MKSVLTPTIPVLAFEVIDSTNAEARRRAEAGEVGPLWITAAVQTAGRGRRGRTWETRTGNLAATLLMLTDKAPAEAAQVSFVVALAVADLAGEYVPMDLVRLKWPNDPMIAGRKTAGILIESGRAPDGRLWLAAGVGVNLAHAPTGTERPATCFADHALGSPPTPQQALDRLALAVAHWLDTWNERGFVAVTKAWTARAWGLGEPCAARLGTETVAGVAEGLDDDGALRLRLPDGGIRRITAGDVFFGEA